MTEPAWDARPRSTPLLDGLRRSHGSAHSDADDPVWRVPPGGERDASCPRRTIAPCCAPRAPPPSSPAAVGRVGLAMTGLGIVWLVHDRTGSYGAARIAVGCFAVADALGGPQVARVVNLLGQRRVLPYVLAAHAASVGLLLVGGPVLDLVAATLVGITLPQLSAMSAARWSALLRGARDEAALPKAFALEALANALSYLAGPALVSTAGAAGRPELGTLLAAALVVGGGLAFALQRRTAPQVAGRAEHRTAGRALLRPAFARQVAFILALGVFFGAMQVSVTAYAVGRGTPDSAPLLYAVSNCTSLLAGWVYGLRAWRTPAGRQRALVATGLTAASLPGSGASRCKRRRATTRSVGTRRQRRRSACQTPVASSKIRQRQTPGRASKVDLER